MKKSAKTIPDSYWPCACTRRDKDGNPTHIKFHGPKTLFCSVCKARNPHITSKVWEKWEEKRAAKAAVQYADALVAELNIDTQQSPLTNAVTETTAVRLAILIVNDIMTDGGNGAKAKRLLLETPGSLYPSKMSGWSENALIERITGIIKAALQQTNIE